MADKRVVCSVRFSKEHMAKFLSHLDIVRIFQRGVRRSRLPVLYSKGYHPRPRLTFARALKLGVESREEVLKLELSEDLPAEEIAAQLNKFMPEGIRILECIQKSS